MTAPDTQPIQPIPTISLADTQPISPPRLPAPRLRPTAPRRWRVGILAGLLLTGGLLLISAALSAFILLRTTPVTLLIDGQAFPTQTRAATVADLLTEQAVAINERDRVIPPLTARLQPGSVIRIDRARPVTLTVDGTTQTIWTPVDQPAAILESAAIAVTTADRLWIDGAPVTVAQLAGWIIPAGRITIRRAVAITLTADGTTQSITSAAATLGELLEAAGVTLYAADSVTVDGAPARLNTPLTAAAVTIVRAAPLRIVVDEAVIETRSSAATVGEALAGVGIALMGLDYSVPGESTALTPGLTIRVYRVKEAVIAEDAPIPYETIYQADAARELDQVGIVQAGQPGVQRTTTRIRYENGIEVGRAVEASYVAAAPQTEIISYGTNVVIRTLNTPNGPVEYWRTFRVYATSYHPAALGGDDVTSIGRRLRHGIVAADPDLLPYGTMVYVERYGTGVIADTGPPRASTRWIDLGYSDADWIGWHHWVTIYLLTPVPATIDYFPPP